MADENILPRDQNHITTAGFENSLVAGDVRPGQIIVATGRVKVDSSGGGSGTVTEIDSGTGIKLTPDPITTTGTVALVDRIAPIATLGSANQLIRVNAGATALEYFTASAGGVASVVGTSNRITVDSTDPAAPIVDIAATYVGQTSITTLGTVATGTWNATVIADGKIASALTGKTYNGLTITSSTGTLTIAAAKVLTVSNTLTFTGTDGSSVNFGTGGTVLYGNQTITLSGDITGSGTTAITTTLATVNSNVGSFGSATQSPTFTVNAKGLTTAAANVTITPAVGSITGLGTGVATWLATPSSANLATAVTDETGSGALVFGTSPTIGGSPVLSAATNLKFTVPTADPSATGVTTNEFNSGYSSTAIGDLVYLDSSATWQKADADASAATYSSMLGIALSVAASGAAVNVLLQGFVYAATPFPTFTIGAPIFMSATAGAMTQTAPVTTDSATRVVGYAIHADKMYFNPSNDWLTNT